MSVNTLDKTRLLNDLKDPESRKLLYKEHIGTGIPFQIHELRKERGLSQKKLGRMMGKDQSFISNLENPNYEYKPQIGTLMALADAFDVPLIVRFGSWTELWDWENNLSPARLAPAPFKEVAAQIEKSVTRRATARFTTTISPTVVATDIFSGAPCRTLTFTPSLSATIQIPIDARMSLAYSREMITDRGMRSHSPDELTTPAKIIKFPLDKGRAA